MDARQRLRLYLEQRRDLGESEFVLDSMTVDEVLRKIDVIASGRTAGPGPESGQTSTPGSIWRHALSAPEVPPVAPPVTPPVTPSVTPLVGRPASFGGLVVDSGASGLFNTDVMRLDSLSTIAAAIEACTRCPLYKTATRGVPGEGNAGAKLVCVGEAPGASEDESGRPFVGAAGQLLTKILAAVELTREEVFITNVMKHRPPGNRNPTSNEIEACSPYLVRKLELIKPKVIVAFGTFAAQTLLNTKTAIGKLRGEVHRYHGIPLIVTYHPAALLRNPAWKRPTWEDVKLARRILDSATGA